MRVAKLFPAIALAAALSGGCLVKKSTHDKALKHVSDLEGQLAMRGTP